ncbi:GNAT family N-acetyltransferase [Alkalimonas collagenimarina]|uniref:GNAT family N-acetyltransferase n=1 Tax=Alkalimonas collagenimarina TaxID=400390 RepID=A0ABT9H094_9GAMM|nr:GNAT family N-acetyltransferase [Alkalimonas collagenimarina]MDP4536698.1 GNAT family N-acetyltransferase [Alkalimonas collagenimarina]
MSVIIRHAELSDAAALQMIYQQPSIFANTLQLPYQSVSHWQALCQPTAGFYNLIAELDGELVGQLGLQQFQNQRRRHVADIGMAVSEPYQGQGIGSALLRSALEMADNWLNIHRLELQVYSSNEAAVALYERFGFEVEAELTDFAFQYGRYVNVLQMARIMSSR